MLIFCLVLLAAIAFLWWHILTEKQFLESLDDEYLAPEAETSPHAHTILTLRDQTFEI